MNKAVKQCIVPSSDKPGARRRAMPALPSAQDSSVIEKDAIRELVEKLTSKNVKKIKTELLIILA